jgi:hypothetical protein
MTMVKVKHLNLDYKITIAGMAREERVPGAVAGGNPYHRTRRRDYYYMS